MLKQFKYHALKLYILVTYPVVQVVLINIVLMSTMIQIEDVTHSIPKKNSVSPNAQVVSRFKINIFIGVRRHFVCSKAHSATDNSHM